jgi:hypothetical protein
MFSAVLWKMWVSVRVSREIAVLIRQLLRHFGSAG